jgi:streptogramin lyase
MKHFALPIALLALLTAACASSGAVGVGTVKDLVPPPKVLPNSVVRIDPRTLKPLQVVPVGSAPDLVIASGGFVWVTHHVLRDVDSGALRNAGDRTLTRVDPSTGKATVVGGGLAPCGLAADPSGDVWVANCFEPGSGQTANIVRVDAMTLAFKATWPVPGGHGFYRGLAYGGDTIWVSDGGAGNTVTQVDPRTGAKEAIRLDRPTGALAWSQAYGDLWINNFETGSLTRLHAKTGADSIVDNVATNPSFPAVAGDTVWAGDWSSPQVERLHAVGSPRPRSIPLPVDNGYAGVWNVAAGAGFVWATTPRDGALWRIDPRTDAVTRVSMPYLPTGVTANADVVWVTVRGK